MIFAESTDRCSTSRVLVSVELFLVYLELLVSGAAGLYEAVLVNRAVGPLFGRLGLVLSPVGQRGSWDSCLGAKGRKNVEHRIGQSFLYARGDTQMVDCRASFWSAGAEVVAFWSDGAELVSLLVCGAVFAPYAGTVGGSWEPSFRGQLDETRRAANRAITSMVVC